MVLLLLFKNYNNNIIQLDYLNNLICDLLSFRVKVRVSYHISKNIYKNMLFKNINDINDL